MTYIDIIELCFAKTKISPNIYIIPFVLLQVPALQTADGKFLFESNAIAYYLSNAQLKGASDFEKAEVLQWLEFAENELLPSACALVFPSISIMQFNKNNFEAAKEDLKRALGVLNARLLDHTYLVGERVTLADVVCFANLLNLYEHVLDPAFRATVVNVNRWFLTILNQPQVKAVVKDFHLCTKPSQFDAKKFAEYQSKAGGQQQQQAQQKKEKPQKEKKEQPKKEAPVEEEMDPAEAALSLEPKTKDPFDSMPKGTFNFDDFKRCYSNEDEAKSIPYFWEKFDPEHYSIWYGEYKYPEELSKVFMSCNLITGMFQRLDKMRKQAFASVCLFGEDNNSTISGVWVWRGQDLAFTLSPDWQVDYEVYDWKKLDAKSEETKKLVAQYFAWSGTDKAGRKFNQGKIFK